MWRQKLMAVWPAFADEFTIIRALSLDMTDTVLFPVLPDDGHEVNYDPTVMKALHAISSRPWTGVETRAFWGEWNHPGEGSRSIRTIIQGPFDYHWDKILKPGIVSIDIGGHSGDTAIPMALLSHRPGVVAKPNVIVVEPNPAVLPVLYANLALNTHFGQFFVVEAAITDVDMAEIELADHGNSECNGGVLNGGLSNMLTQKLTQIAGVTYKARGVSMETLFQQIAAITSDPVGFIKIDCEGYDKEILRPCRDLLAASKPALFVEWFAWFEPEDDADLFKVIESIDYLPFDPLTLKRANVADRIGDLLCFHKDQIPDYVS
jgi:FkbM family methyltransferase